IIEYLKQQNVGYAYGSLTSGGEILSAEACLRANVELHVVLPFEKNEFVELMVRAAGSSWVRRFDTCLHQAKSVTFATTDSYRGDSELLAYARKLTMGMAVLRAQHLTTAALHLNLRMDNRGREKTPCIKTQVLWNFLARARRHAAVSPERATS